MAWPSSQKHGSSAALFNRMEALESELSHQQAYTGSARWMIPYADLLTLLLGFFVILYGMTVKDQESLKGFTLKLQSALQQQPLPEVPGKNPAVAVQGGAATPVPVEKNPEKDPLMLLALEDEASRQALEKNLKETLGLTEGLEVSHQEAGMVISLKENLLFSPGSATLTPAAQQTLTGLADYLKTLPHPIRVEGHTDNTPIATRQFPSNWELSTARATGILRYLIGEHHFSPQRLSAVGYGEYHPIAENSTIYGKQKNRRVDIVIVNTSNPSELKTLSVQKSDVYPVHAFSEDPKELWQNQPNPKI